MHTALLNASAVLAQVRWDHMRGWDGGWMWLWGTLMMLTWVAVIGVAVWLILRSVHNDRNSSNRRQGASTDQKVGGSSPSERAGIPSESEELVTSARPVVEPDPSSPGTFPMVGTA
jgi:hypothetical protein